MKAQINCTCHISCSKSKLIITLLT